MGIVHSAKLWLNVSHLIFVWTMPLNVALCPCLHRNHLFMIEYSDTIIVFPEKNVKMEMTAYLLQGLKYGI